MTLVQDIDKGYPSLINKKARSAIILQDVNSHIPAYILVVVMDGIYQDVTLSTYLAVGIGAALFLGMMVPCAVHAWHIHKDGN